MHTNTFEAPNGSDFAPFRIADSVTENVDREDIRELHAKTMDEGDSRIAFLRETFRDLDRMNFILSEGCELRDGFPASIVSKGCIIVSDYSVP